MLNCLLCLVKFLEINDIILLVGKCHFSRKIIKRNTPIKHCIFEVQLFRSCGQKIIDKYLLYEDNLTHLPFNEVENVKMSSMF